MLRTNWTRSAKAAVAYMSNADYYATSPGELLGKGFEQLNIGNMTARDVLERLAHNLDPATGNILRKHAKEGDRVGMDFTFNAPKSVTLAREISGIENAGDDRVEAAHREAVKYAMEHIEEDMQTRVRVGKADEDRKTGNLFAYRVTHRDTRINPGDQMPDPHLHDHVLVFNLTFDAVEQKFKAAQIGQIKHDANYYEAIYMNRLAGNLRDLGYGVRREGRSFEVAGIDRPLIEKFSRRTKQIEEVAAKLKIQKAESKAKLGATTRAGKTKETAEDLNPYYVSRLTEPEKQKLTGLIGQKSYESSNEKAVTYAISHVFERQSVAEEKKLYEVAIRHGIGSVTPEGVIAEAKRQGALLKEGQVTTRAVLAEESRIIDFAREGKSTMRPLSVGPRSPVIPPLGRLHATSEKDVSAGASSGVGGGLDASVSARPGSPRETDLATSIALGQQKGRPDESKRPPIAKVVSDHATLSPEQQAVSHSGESGSKVKYAGDKLSSEQAALVNHVLTSTDSVILIQGAAGTGKTTAVKSAFDRIQCPVEILAPSAEASRGVLRSEGFQNADTVASFLLSEKRQEAVKGGVIWVDEAALMPIRDLSALTDIAKAQHARIVLMGDTRQHLSVARGGNMMNVLQEYAGLPVGKLTEIWRQRDKGYKAIVADIAAGRREKAFDNLVGLDWVQKVENNAPLIDDYLAAQKSGKSVLIVAPTHAEGDEITADLRARLKADGKLGEDHAFKQLVNLNWTDAEKGDAERYSGEEWLAFHRNSGSFKAGQRVRYADLKPEDHWLKPEHFSVFGEAELPIAAGDRIRFTANGKTADGHKLNNGSVYCVKGFDKGGNLVLDNGWTVSKGYGHFNHGYVSTSHSSQGRTTDRVLIALGSESKGAITAEAFYVSVSRGRESAKVYSDMPAEELKRAIQRTDTRKSATELIKPKKKRRYEGVWKFLQKAKERFKKLRTGLTHDSKELVKQREHTHER